MSTVFLDIDTQLDFLYPAGALYVPGAEQLIPTLARLTNYAEAHGIPLVSTVDAHAENDREFQSWPKHCVAGATGQHKAAATLLGSNAVIPDRPEGFAVPNAHQFIIEKQTVDVFQTHTIARLLQALNPDRFVVYGVVTEICVLHAVRGLFQFCKPIAVVTDAIRELTGSACHQAFGEMRAGGASLTTSSEVLP
jgi:nicotinamidase/pyrazinamidase